MVCLPKILRSVCGILGRQTDRAEKGLLLPQALEWWTVRAAGLLNRLRVAFLSALWVVAFSAAPPSASELSLSDVQEKAVQRIDLGLMPLPDTAAGLEWASLVDAAKAYEGKRKAAAVVGVGWGERRLRDGT